MAKPFVVMEKPIFIPYVCIQCGVGDGRREWYVDLGFSIDHFLDTDSVAVYLCNECYVSMTMDVGRLISQFRKEHEKWQGAEPTYEWARQHDDRRFESTGSIEGSTSVDSGTDGNDQDAESNDSESESSDSGDANPVDDSNPDESEGGISIKFGSS